MIYTSWHRAILLGRTQQLSGKDEIVVFCQNVVGMAARHMPCLFDGGMAFLWLQRRSDEVCPCARASVRVCAFVSV